MVLARRGVGPPPRERRQSERASLPPQPLKVCAGAGGGSFIVPSGFAALAALPKANAIAAAEQGLEGAPIRDCSVGPELNGAAVDVYRSRGDKDTRFCQLYYCPNFI